MLIALFLCFASMAKAQVNTDHMMRVGRNALYFSDYVLSIQYFNLVLSAKPYLYEPYFFRGLAKFYLDDFGTGYSSLNMLKMTCIDILKIDKSFIPLEEECKDKNKDCIMFENIAHLAKELGVMVVAEGVETKKQYEYLKHMGCDIIQGYYFDKPLVQDEFLDKVKKGRY